MVTVSDSAKDKIVELRNADGHVEDYQIRVGVLGGGCSGLTYNLEFNSETKPTDMVFEDKGSKLLLIKRAFFTWPERYSIFQMA